MAGDGNSESADLQVILERTDPAKNVARYYVLPIEATLFARNTLVRRWGRMGSPRGSVWSSSTAGIPPGWRWRRGWRESVSGDTC